MASLKEIVLGSHIEQLYDDCEPSIKELLLEKDCKMHTEQQHHFETMQQFEKRIIVLEKKIHDLQEVSRCSAFK